MYQSSLPQVTTGGVASVITLCDYALVNGGQAKVAIESALRLKERGLDVCFVAGRGPVDERLITAGVDCRVAGDHDILSDPNRIRAAANGIWNRDAARVAAEAIAERDPKSTVIHIHGWAKALSPSVGPVVTKSRAAHVYTLHEYFLACPNGGFFDYRTRQICKRHALGFDCLRTPCDPRANTHKAWRVVRQAVLRAAGRMPQHLREIIYLAPEQREIMGSYISPEARWHYLPNPVAARPSKRIAAEENEIFLFVGRLSAEKGAEVVASAAKLAGAQIVFCGDGECTEAAVQANPDAIMTGWVSQDELATWMKRARALVFPSLWYEGYPLVVADALRAGLPVIVSDSTVAASSVRHGVEGLHAPAGDVRAWADAMAQFRCDDAVRSSSEAAFTAGGQLLDGTEHTDRLIEIYERALTRRQTSEVQQETFVP